MITINKATKNGIQALSRKLSDLLEDEKGQLYQDNVAKFGIPEEYVRKAFSKEALMKAVASNKSAIYLALENKCKILGFAQTLQHSIDTIGLDRIVVFPKYTRKGIGTKLLEKIIRDHKSKGGKTIIVNAGKEEIQARRFYEKNGFRLIKEEIVDAPWGRKLNLAIYQCQLEDS